MLTVFREYGLFFPRNNTLFYLIMLFRRRKGGHRNFTLYFNCDLLFVNGPLYNTQHMAI